jgi:hypothetical protein
MSLVRINRNPTDRQLSVFALAWLLCLGILGAQAWHRDHLAVAKGAWALAVAVPVTGLLNRESLRWVYLALTYATYPIGFVVSRVLLALAYYLALTPIGLTMRLFRYDPLARRFDREASSYWTARPGPPPPESYFNQR